MLLFCTTLLADTHFVDENSVSLERSLKCISRPLNIYAWKTISPPSKASFQNWNLHGVEYRGLISELEDGFSGDEQKMTNWNSRSGFIWISKKTGLFIKNWRQPIEFVYSDAKNSMRRLRITRSAIRSMWNMMHPKSLPNAFVEYHISADANDKFQIGVGTKYKINNAIEWD